MGVTEPICKVPKWLNKEGNFRPSPIENKFLTWIHFLRTTDINHKNVVAVALPMPALFH
jgi:hypothetical protein